MRDTTEVDDPRIIQRIHDILIPREFTRLDEIVDIVFSATEDVKAEPAESESLDEIDDTSSSREPKFTPVSFHKSCVDIIEKYLGRTLVKRTRTGYSTADNTLALTCSVSKAYEKGDGTWYWFAFHPHQQEFLEAADRSFVAFGCGSADITIIIPAIEFLPWLDQMNTTVRDDRLYWHVHISRQGGELLLHLKRDFKNIDLSRYLIDQTGD